MATHCSILASKSPWTEETGGRKELNTTDHTRMQTQCVTQFFSKSITLYIVTCMFWTCHRENKGICQIGNLRIQKILCVFLGIHHQVIYNIKIIANA